MNKIKSIYLGSNCIFYYYGWFIFFTAEGRKAGGVISPTASRVQESPNPDDETSGIVKTSKQETWNVINVNKKNILDINTFNDFGKRSDLVIPG